MIIFWQETQFTKEDENKEWSGKIFCSHGTTNGKGVAILIPHNMNQKFAHISQDSEGHMLLIDCSLEENKFILLNVYAPKKG